MDNTLASECVLLLVWCDRSCSWWVEVLKTFIPNVLTAMKSALTQAIDCRPFVHLVSSKIHLI